MDPTSNKPIDLGESVAGEEDPGASIDMALPEIVCPTCGGSGKLAGGPCPECEGTGKVTTGSGAA